MRFSNTFIIMSCLLASGALCGFQVRAGTLDAAEVSQIETDLGITLTEQEKIDLGNLVKPETIDPWRTAAELRIAANRQSDFHIRVEDANGNPVPGAQVAVKLNKNSFKFGGVCSVEDLTDAAGKLAADGSTTDDWKRITTNLFNAVGLNNGFKPKITSQHQYIPGFMSWASANGLDTRAHLLMWPGAGDVADLGGVAGIDYGGHLSTASTSDFASYNVRGAVEAYAGSVQDQAAKDALKSVVDAEIQEWAGRWNVYEWDVINETRGNTLLQQILGFDQEEEWFAIAANNIVNPAAKLYINENQIISAKSTSLSSTYYNDRRDIYFNTIDRLVTNNAPVHGIGFQNRYKWEHLDPAEAYSRLDDFGSRYGLQLAGTEFEIIDLPPFIPGEYVRGQITEETMTIYYSHALATGLNAWDYMENNVSSLCYYDGTVKLNGLVWYYLHRIRYTTDTNSTTDVSGGASVMGYKGDYDITVTYNGTDYPASATLSGNQTLVVALDDVFLAPSDNPPVFTVDPISKPNATPEAAYSGESISGSATDADGDTLNYFKLAGPAWLTVALNGDLSGTPTSADSGQNSWVVQVSDGYDTAQATLKITVNGAGGSPASISIEETDQDGFSTSSGEVTGSLSTKTTAEVGDMIVVTVATNKKGTPEVSPITLTQTGGSGSTGAPTLLTNDLSTYPTSWGWYMPVTAAGTFTYDLDSSNITANAALHVLRADTGQIGLADSATWDDTDNADNGTSYSLDYTFGSVLNDGVLIEAISARTDLITAPAAYTEVINGSDKRIVTHLDGVTNSSWSSVYSLSGGVANRQTSGALGMIFVGLGSLGGGNSPPVFGLDPVVENGAIQDEVYTGSTLADHASDANLDTMTFARVSGPAWLHVETNGALAGTPLSIDLGTNSWKVSVSDGMATNFTTLQIIVGEPLPPLVSPQNGTNILFIAIDDMKPLLGCYGDPLAITPSIDSLASSGVAFQNAQCQWAVCGPSRASIMTGLYPEETGVMGFKTMRGNSNIVRPNMVTIQQWFRYHGYRTTATGKINDPRCVGSMDPVTGVITPDNTVSADVDDPPSWGDPVDPNNLPADFFSNSSYVPYPSGWSPEGNPSTGSVDLPDSDFQDGKICDQGISMLQNLATNDTRFFLGVGFKKPHLPFVAPQQYWDLYNSNDFSVAEFQEHPLHAVSYTWNYAKELASFDDFYDPIGDPGGTGISCTNITAWKQQELLHGYYACASFIDAQIGRLLTELETLGLHTNTIVVVWGDHGFHLGDHAEWAKHTNLEQAARSPLVIYSPFTGVAGAKPTSPVNFVDLYPTLCELAGLPIPQQPLAENEDPFAPAAGRALKGKSLVPVMQDPTISLRTGALTLFSRNGAMGYSYRTERYRYIEWISGGSVVARELYDYALDPLETVNLAGEEGYAALMLQYSQSMRFELDARALSSGDIACADLQNSPFYDTTGGDLTIPLDGWERTETGFTLYWPSAAGQSYNLMLKTNLLDAVWLNEQTGLTNGGVNVSDDKPRAFYQIELD